jgi:hypothetical protein
LCLLGCGAQRCLHIRPPSHLYTMSALYSTVRKVGFGHGTHALLLDLVVIYWATRHLPSSSSLGLRARRVQGTPPSPRRLVSSTATLGWHPWRTTPSLLGWNRRSSSLGLRARRAQGTPPSSRRLSRQMAFTPADTGATLFEMELLS